MNRRTAAYMSADKIFIWSRAFRGFTGASFIVVFPWVLTKAPTSPSVAAFISMALIIECFLDVLTSFYFDFLSKLKIRRFFQITPVSEASAFACLWMAANQTTSMSFACVLILALTLYTFGTAIDGGAFDAWAITSCKTTEFSIKPFDKDAMFLSANRIERMFSCLGAGSTGLLIYLNEVPGQPSVFVPCMVVIFVYLGYLVFLNNRLPNAARFTVDEQSELARPSSALLIFHKSGALRLAFSRDALRVLLLLTLCYTAGQMITFGWPLLIGSKVGAYKPFVPTALQLLGVFGAVIAPFVMAISGKDRLSVAKSCTMAFGALFLVLGFLLSKEGEEWMWPFVVLVLARVLRFVSLPYLSSLVHDGIQDENVRATVVSLRSATSNLCAAAVFLGATLLGENTFFKVVLIVGALILLGATIVPKDKHTASA